MITKKIPGFRFFECKQCSFSWRSPTSDSKSLTQMSCPECKEPTDPYQFQLRPDWPLDSKGRLIVHVPEFTKTLPRKAKI